MSQNTNLTFVSLQRDYWDSPWQNRHAFLWELAERCPVFFQTPTFYLVDLLHRRYRTAMASGLHRIKPGLLVNVPSRCLPYNYRFPRLDRSIARIRDGMNEKAALQNGFDRPVLLIWHPCFAGELNKFDERLVVYYKYDNYAGYYTNAKNSGTSGDGGDTREELLLERADLIFVTSQGLYEMHRAHEYKLHLMPNGVDFDHFNSIVTDANCSIPEELERIPSPRIGYIGVINEKVDFRLLTKLCRARPNWSIVLIGPDRTQQAVHLQYLAELKTQANVHFLGQREGREIPGYLKGMDVCMMCYLVNDWTYYGYPLKMHEYLASGKPVVASGLPAIKEFSRVIAIASTTEQWLQAIDDGLTGRTDNTPEERIAVARENSWRSRVEASLELIAEKIGNKG